MLDGLTVLYRSNVDLYFYLLGGPQVCVQRPPLGPQKVAVIERWSLVQVSLYYDTEQNDLVFIVRRMSLF